LQITPSAGSYFNSAIRSVYEYKKVLEIPTESIKEEMPEKEFENTSGVEDFKEEKVGEEKLDL
jgi:hypothetical protein